MAIKVQAPLVKEEAKKLRAGDSCLISGTIFVARDAAHKRLCELIEQGKPLPFDVKNSVVYFAGPTPAKPGQVIGSAGPTSSYRMDPYSYQLIALGQTGMIGKGKRDKKTVEAMMRYCAVYFGAIGGCGALLSDCIKKAEIVAYEDLGAEALLRVEVEDFPVVVVIDSIGTNLYETGREKYLNSI